MKNDLQNKLCNAVAILSVLAIANLIFYGVIIYLLTV